MNFILKSHDFKEGTMIPECFTCDDQDCSPSLFWENIPVGTLSFALIVDDPDAPMGIWDHWIVYNLPSDCMFLPQGIKNFPESAIQGLNSWGKTGYGGPCPPDCEHRYFFKIYALDKMLENKGAISKTLLLQLMEGHVLGIASLMGRYDLKKRRR